MHMGIEIPVVNIKTSKYIVLLNGSGLTSKHTNHNVSSFRELEWKQKRPLQIWTLFKTGKSSKEDVPVEQLSTLAPSKIIWIGDESSTYTTGSAKSTRVMFYLLLMFRSDTIRHFSSNTMTLLRSFSVLQYHEDYTCTTLGFIGWRNMSIDWYVCKVRYDT